MSDTEREGLCKLFQIAYLNAYKARPFVDFTDWVEWAELNGIKFNVTAYKNRTQCTKFVNFISKTLFEEDVKSKLKMQTLSQLFCDGSTDSAVIEKECIYILFIEPFDFESILYFIALKDVPSQDADQIKSAIMKAFDDIGMPGLKDRMVFLASDSTSVNSEIKTGVATKFCKDGIDWLVCLVFVSSIRISFKRQSSGRFDPSQKKLNQLVLFVTQILKELRRIT